MYLIPTIMRVGLLNQMSIRSNPNLHVQTSQPIQYQLQHGRSEMLWEKTLLNIFSAFSKVCHDGPSNNSKTQVTSMKMVLLGPPWIFDPGPPEMRTTAKLMTLRISYPLPAAQTVSWCHGCFSGLPQILIVMGNGLLNVSRRVLLCSHPAKHHRISAGQKYL